MNELEKMPLRLDTKICVLLFVVILISLINLKVAFAEETSANVVTGPALQHNPLEGPDSSSVLLDEEAKNNFNLLERWDSWKKDLKTSSGFGIGADYTAVGLTSSSSLGDDSAASGMIRIFGSWDLVNRDNSNTGSIQFKFEHRHAYTDVTPQLFGAQVGYAGVPEPVFNDDRYRTTTLYWKQYFQDKKSVGRVGFIDVKEYFDVYALASPWTGFHNLALSTGSNTMTNLPDGAFGLMYGGYLSDRYYAAASIVDASADPTDVFQGFDTFFSDFDTFKTLEFGITGGGKSFFLDNAHIALWQIDESKETGSPDGWGINASISTAVNGQWLPFFRAASSHKGGGIYEASVSTGFGYLPRAGGNLLGVGINWGRPNSDTIPLDLDDQWTGEVFYRVQLTKHMQLAPSVQLLIDPALNPDKDFVALYGLRFRLLM